MKESSFPKSKLAKTNSTSPQSDASQNLAISSKPLVGDPITNHWKENKRYANVHNN